MAGSRIVFILGATGTGKSNLAVKIAKRFNGEIVSADSMQVYKGLDVLTNKIKESEKEGIPHHLLDILNCTERFSVLDFRNRALPIIEDIIKRKKLPIVVGGTNYYIEAILWKILVEKEEEAKESQDLAFNRHFIAKSDQWHVEKLDVLKGANVENFSTIPDVFEGVTAFLDSAESYLRDVTKDVTIPFKYYKNTFYRYDETYPPPRSCSETWPDVAVDVASVESNLLRWFAANVLAKSSPVVPEDFETSADDAFSHFTPENALNGDLDGKCRFDSARRILSALYPCDLSEECKMTFKEAAKKIETVAVARKERVHLLRIADDERMREFDNERLYRELNLVDPESAAGIHFNNRRRSIRVLQVFYLEGRTLSEIVREQRSLEGATSSMAPLRFTDACVFWLHCDQDTLEKRLDDRADEMMKNGLVEELERFYKNYSSDLLKYNIEANFQKGIFQSIGFKEFHNYIFGTSDDRKAYDGERMLEYCARAYKIATKKYARSQVRWIQNNFIKIREKPVPPLFRLDCSREDETDENASGKAMEIVRAYAAGGNLRESGYAPVPLEEAHPDRDVPGTYYCESCRKSFVGRYQWRIHVASKKHRRRSLPAEQRSKCDREDKTMKALARLAKKVPR